MSVIVCVTDSNGYANFIFNAPQVSGNHIITAGCVNPGCTGPASGNINVKVPGLETITASQFYMFIGGEADKPHHDNHYLIPEAASVLWRIGWVYSNLNSITDGLAPGKSQDGFEFSSKDIPGIGIAQLSAHSPVPMFPAEGPTGELAKEFAPIEQNDYVSRPTAVPAIAVPAPFDPAVTLERIQTQTHTWIASQLLAPVFSSQLDRYFQSSIGAYSLNQLNVGKKQIQAMRELIKKEQPDADREDVRDDGGDDHDTNKRALIDKLAARILDFDLKYVTERTGGDKDD